MNCGYRKGVVSDRQPQFLYLCIKDKETTKGPPIRGEAGAEVVLRLGHFFPTSRAEPERAIHLASEGVMKRP